MKLRVLIPTLIASMLIVSCGKKSDTKESKKTVKLTEEQIQSIMDNQYFECASISGDNCPSGISRLFMLNVYEPERSGVCSGFMIDQDTLVTNAHCVSSQSQCNTTHIAVYDGYGNYTKTKCEKIVASRLDRRNPNDPRKSLDYTILKVSDVIYSTPVSLSPTRVSPEDVLNVWVIDHKSLYTARISQFNCEVVNQNQYSSVMLERCPIIGGNSGSPAMNQNNEVVGVIWGSTVDNMDEDTPLRTRRSVGGMALMTDLFKFIDPL